MNALIEKSSPVHFRASLEGRDVGTLPTLDDARAGIARAMEGRYALVPAGRTDGRLFTPAPEPMPGQTEMPGDFDG